MGRWIIASSIAATALAVWLVLEPSASPPSDWAALLLARVPVLAFALLAAYAGFVLLAATAVVIIDLARVRSRLMQLKPAITRQTWNATFARTVLVKLTYRTLDLVTAPTAPPDTELVQGRFDFGAARREIAQLYWHCLTRVQFATALAILCGILGIELARDYFQFPLVGASLLSASAAVAALLTLGFIAACARLTVAVAGERLLDALERAPVQRLETTLLQLLTSLTAGGTGQSAERAASAAATAPLERLTTILSADREAQRTTITHLSANCETLTAAAHALSERAILLNTTSLDPAGISELSSAIVRLAAAVDELRAQQSLPADRTLPIPAEQSSPLGSARLDLRQEFRRLRANLD